MTWTADYTFCHAVCLVTHSPDGATAVCSNSSHMIVAYCSFIDPERMKGWVGWSTVDSLPISCMSGAGQGKSAGHRPTFYHWATSPTNLCHAKAKIKTLFLTNTRNCIMRQTFQQIVHFHPWVSVAFHHCGTVTQSDGGPDVPASGPSYHMHSHSGL